MGSDSLVTAAITPVSYPGSATCFQTHIGTLTLGGGNAGGPLGGNGGQSRAPGLAAGRARRLPGRGAPDPLTQELERCSPTRPRTIYSRTRDPLRGPHTKQQPILPPPALALARLEMRRQLSSQSAGCSPAVRPTGSPVTAMRFVSERKAEKHNAVSTVEAQ